MYNTFIIQESLMDSNLRNIEKTPLGTIKFVAVLQEANRPNRNHRIYPKETLVKALADPYVQERLRTNSWYGEAGHPLDTSLARQTNIMHDNIAFLIHKVWWEGNLLMGECETANTSRGKDMAGLIEQNSRVAFSLRAQGSLNEPDSMSGIRTVAPNLKIITFDWVINPSHDVAFITSLCNETKESMFNSAKPTAAHISEACALCESGQMFAVEENVEPIVENYVPGYRKSVRAANEIYVREDNDTLLVESIKNDCAEVQNGNVTKKVVLEDFLTQDIRSSICQLNEQTLDESFFSRIFGNVGRYKKSDLNIARLIDAYLYENAELKKYHFLHAELRTAAREDEKCNEIIDLIENEISLSKQDKARIKGLVDRFKARLDYIVRDLLKDPRHNAAIKEAEEIEAAYDENEDFFTESCDYDTIMLNESLNFSDKFRWSLAKTSIKFLKEEQLTKFLTEFFKDTDMQEDWKAKTKKEKVQKVRDILNRLNDDQKYKILNAPKLNSKEVKKAEKLVKDKKLGISAAVAGATSTVGGAITYGVQRSMMTDNYYRKIAFGNVAKLYKHASIAQGAILFTGIGLQVLGILLMIGAFKILYNNKDMKNMISASQEKENKKSVIDQYKNLKKVEDDKKLR